MSYFRPCRLASAITLMVLCAPFAGCNVEEPPGEPLYSLEVREAYGDKGVRAVGVSVNIAQGDSNTLQLNNVKLNVTPAPPHSLNKLESQLGESVLHGGSQYDWPSAVLRPVPQAVPVLTRIQTAIALMQPRDITVERATANIFDTPPSIGYTRLKVRGDAIEITTVALTTIESKALTVVAAAKGTRSLMGKPGAHGFTVEGKRWILGESTEQLRVSGHVRSVDNPARAEEQRGD